MNEFEKQTIALLSDIHAQISAIRKQVEDALSKAEETNSELLNSVFGLLQQGDKD